VAFNQERHAELLEQLLSADREESEALAALTSFVVKNEVDPKRFAALTAASEVAAEKRRAVVKALNDLLDSY
jgi:hypothetical protein